jgi:chitin synthase
LENREAFYADHLPVVISVKAAIQHTTAPVIPLVLLALILGLPAVLIVLTAHRWSYVAWMLVYLISLPIWNFVLPTYAYWKFDDFSWGDTRKTAGEKVKKAGYEYEGEFDSSKITMKRWGDFEQGRIFMQPRVSKACNGEANAASLERRMKAPSAGWSQQATSVASWPTQQPGYEPYHDNY